MGEKERSWSCGVYIWGGGRVGAAWSDSVNTLSVSVVVGCSLRPGWHAYRRFFDTQGSREKP